MYFFAPGLVCSTSFSPCHSRPMNSGWPSTTSRMSAGYFMPRPCCRRMMTMRTFLSESAPTAGRQKAAARRSTVMTRIRVPRFDRVIVPICGADGHRRMAECATAGVVRPLTGVNAAGHRACDSRCVSLTKGDMHEAWKTGRKSYSSSSDGRVWLCVRAEHVDVFHVLQLRQPGGSAERGARCRHLHEEHGSERSVLGQGAAGFGHDQPGLVILLERLRHAAGGLVLQHGRVVFQLGPVLEQHRP